MSLSIKKIPLSEKLTDRMLSISVGLVAISLTIFKALLPRLPRWDALDYLMTAQWIAGKRIAFPANEPIPGMVDARAPVVPYFVSWGFKLFGFKLTVGYAISAVFFGLGIVAVYLLSRTFMSARFSMLAALLFAFNPIIFDWAGQVYTNVEVAAMMTLTFWAFAKAQENVNYSVLAVPLLVLTALTRYSGALLIIPIYYMLKIAQDFSILTWKKIRWGLLIGSITLVSVTFSWASYLVRNFGPFFYPKIINFYLFRPLGTNNRFVSPLGPAYYLANSPKLLGIGWTAFPILALFLTGIFMCRYAFTEKERPIVAAIRIWFFVSFIFYSVAGVKDLRYAAEFLVPISIFAAVGFKLIVEQLTRWHWARYLAAVGIVLTLAFSAYGVFDLPGPTEDDIVTNKEAKDTADWVSKNLPRASRLASNIWPYINWYGQRDTRPTLQPSDLVKPVDFTNYSNELAKKNISYVTFLSPGHALDPAGYLTPIWKSPRGGMVVYKVKRRPTSL